MTRKKVREHIFVLLFRVDFHKKEELTEQVSIYMDELEEASEKEKQEIQDKFYAIVDHMEQLDNMIEDKIRGWKLQRLAKADITLLRLAAYEIVFDEEVPDSVAINEAVEMSKQYGTDKSTSFVNGVLSSIVKEVEAERDKTKIEN